MKESRKSSREIVKSANQQWNQALNQGELESLIDLYGDSATVSPGDGTLLEGHDEIRKLFLSLIHI